MRERPILFNGAMVRAILSGAKTQTRRVVKPRKDPDYGCQLAPSEIAGDENQARLCPYGLPGDRLWVRETWGYDEADNGGDRHWQRFVYRADPGAQPLDNGTPRPWRPSIHMPRAASRITLEITDIRVERLQRISEADARAEGCERLDEDEPGHVYRYEPDWKICPQCGGTRLYTAFGASGGALPDTDCLRCDTYVKRYRHLWESINGQGSWDANPWVWVVSFQRIGA